MSDLISRKETLRAIDSLGECYISYYELLMLICRLSSAEPKQKKGKWENIGINTYELSYGTIAYEPLYQCSACGGVTESYLRLDEPIMPEDADFPNFCPHCGADMREEHKDIPIEYFKNEEYKK